MIARTKIFPVGGTQLNMLRVGDDFDTSVTILDDNGQPLPPGMIPFDAEAFVWWQDAVGQPRNYGVFSCINLASGVPNTALIRSTIIKAPTLPNGQPAPGKIQGTYFNQTDDATPTQNMIHPALATSEIVLISKASEMSDAIPGDKGIRVGVNLNGFPPDRPIFVIYNVDGPLGWADFYPNRERARHPLGAWDRMAHAGFPNPATVADGQGARWLWQRGNHAGPFTITAQIYDMGDLLTTATKTFTAPL